MVTRKSHRRFLTGKPQERGFDSHGCEDLAKRVQFPPSSLEILLHGATGRRQPGHEAPSFQEEINMLVLSRKKSEAIRIGEIGEIKVSILEICGDKIRIGIEAPSDVPVYREEIYLKIQGNKDDRASDCPQQ